MLSPFAEYTAGTHSVPLTKRTLLCDATAGDVILDIPDTGGKADVNFLAIKISDDVSANLVTINPPAGKTINGLASIDLTGPGQALWICSKDGGDFFIASGGTGGTSIGRDIDSSELGSNDTIGTSLQDVTGVTITLVLAVAGKVKFGVTGVFSAVGLFGGSLGVKIGSTDYDIISSGYVVGSGGDFIGQDPLSGSRTIFLTAGTYTVKMRASSNTNPSTLLAHATLDIDFPVRTGAVGVIGTVPTGPASGDLDNDYPGPIVVGIQGDVLPSLAAGESMRKNAGNTGWEAYTPGAGSSVTEEDIRLGKPFFTANSLLPGTTVKEELHTFPAPDISNLNGGTLSRTMGSVKYTTSGTNVHNFAWDAGSLKTKLLLIMCGVRARNFGLQLFFSSTAPGVGEIPDGSYVWGVDIFSASSILYKKTGGVFTSLGSDNTWIFADAYTSAGIDIAFYYDDSTGELKGFFRLGMQTWCLVVPVTDSSFTTMRYAGVRIQSSGGLVMRVSCPMAFYCA